MQINWVEIMNKKIFVIILSLLVCTIPVSAQQVEKSSFHQRADEASAKGPESIAMARSLYIRSFEDYANKGKMRQSVECGVKGVELYYKENYYKEAFDLLRRIDQAIENAVQASSEKAALHYLTANERLQMYIKMRKADRAKEQLTIMEANANASGDEDVKNDLLYTKTVYYYTFGLTDKGNATFKEMASKLTAQKEYGKVDEVYQTLIANGRRSNSASMVAQSYSSYMAWKDSVAAIKRADEIGALKQQIADNETAIAEKDSSLTSRKLMIIGLSILAAVLAAMLVVGAVVLLRFIVLTRRQKKTIKQLNENNALKAKFISNISAQLEPTLCKLDGRIPEVKALQDFSNHIQTLSNLESQPVGEVELEDTQIPPFCDSLMDEIKGKVRPGVTLTVNAPKMTARINREYVAHVLRHLLNNAAEYTPADGRITLEFKKRSAHKHQFLVSDTGQGIAEDRHEDIFKPFLEIRDLTTGDGLGLPICKQMAIKMNGDLDLDAEYVKGARFVLDLYV